MLRRKYMEDMSKFGEYEKREKKIKNKNQRENNI